MIANFTQFLLPNGRRVHTTIELPDELAPKVKALEDAGCRLTCEILMNGICSFCIEEPALGDFDAVLSKNDESVKGVITTMINRFDIEQFNKWKADQE